MITNVPSRKLFALGLLLLCHVYYFQIYKHFTFTNEKTRFLLVSAIVDDGTVSINQALERWGDSQDKSSVNGRFYCDKAIGTSIFGIPVYTLLRTAGKSITSGWSVDAFLFVLRVVCVTIPALLFLFPLSRFWSELNPERSYLPILLFLFTFGTIVFLNSSQYISHHLEGIFLFLAFYFVYQGKQSPEKSTGKFLLSGVFAGLGLITEYPAVFPVFAIFVYLLVVAPSKMKTGWFIAGAIPFVAGALFYNYLIFGTPFDVTYRHENDPGHVVQHSQGFIGLGFPDANVAWNLLFSRARGLFFFSPFLLFGIPGLFYLIRDRTWRKEGVLFSVIILSYFLFHGGMSNWHGGWSLGPRYLAAILPFLASGVVYFFASERIRQNRYATGLLLALGLYSVIVVTAGTITFPFPDQDLVDPVFMLFFPFLAHNAGGWNIGNWVGLSGLSSALVFYVLLLMTFLVMVLPRGTVVLPARPVILRWGAGVAAAFLILVAGRLSMPPMRAFDYYAVGSDFLFVGLYEDSLEELNLALSAQPDPHLRGLILSRIRHVSMVGKISVVRVPQ